MPDLLEALGPRVVPVEVKLPYGDTITVNMGSLSLSEWDALGEAVPQPEGDYVGHNSQGQEIRSYTTPRYLKAAREADAERRWRRLTMGLLRGGNAIDGLMFEDQVKRVRENMDTAIAAALMSWQASLVSSTKAAVVDRSKRFQPVGIGKAEGDAALEAEPADVGTIEPEPAD